ncbi:MAG: fused MFS/spermidine synthase [Verrucomicrobia bacterium]|nr:fused MFS/spermidine synthase [Verrucomicrobiota bacterium]
MTAADTLPPRAGRLLLLAVGGLGAASVIAQLVLMREMLAAFAGNEMVLGIILGNWLLLTGAGAWLGRASGRLRNREGAFIAALIFIAVAPLVQVFLLAVLRNAVFGRGIQVGLTETVLASFVVLLPFCVASGWLLTLACSAVTGKSGASGIGRVYVADCIGSIAGGALFSFVLVRFFDHLGILFFPALLNLLLAGALAVWFGKKLLLAVAAILAAALAGVILFANADALATDIQFAGQHVVFRGNSPYGKLVVTDSSGQYNFIENGLPLTSTDSTQQVEETVHYAMAQRPGARRVLIVCGGVSGTAREVLKYGAVDVTCVELDPLIIEAGYRFLPDNMSFIRTGEGPSTVPHIRFVNTDGRLFVKQTADLYDVVIVDVPDPSTSQLNRFYTAEFFGEVKRVLSDGGVLSFGLGRYADYVSPELARLLTSARRTLDTAFKNTLVIPGGRVFFLASDGPLHEDIAARIEAARIPTRLVNRHYLKAMLAPDRLEDMRRATSQPAAVNRDFSPVLYYYHLRHWMSQFTVKFGLLEAALVALLAVYLFRLRAAALAVFAGGFAASGLEVVLLLAFQILYGSVYQQLGIIVTVFMAGLAAGAFGMNRLVPRASRNDLARLAFAVAAFAALLPLCLMALARVGGSGGFLLVQTVIALLTFLLAALVGMQFPLAGRVSATVAAVYDRRNPSLSEQPAVIDRRYSSETDSTATASRLYTADFIGACLGALLPSTLLIPLIGVPAVCLLIAALNAVAGVVVMKSSRY